MVRLQNQGVEIRESAPRQLAARAQIGHQPHSPTLAILNHHTDGLAGIVGNAEGLDSKAADFGRSSRAQGVNLEPVVGQVQLFEGPCRGIDRHAVASGEALDPASVIGVFVGEDQTLEVRSVDSHLGKPFLDLATGEPGVHHQTFATALEHQHVASAARSKNGDSHLGVVKTEGELHSHKVSQGNLRQSRYVLPCSR